jgi:anti-sigma factor RsiW
MDTRRGNRNPDFNPPESFLEKLDKFLDLYEYVDGEAVRKRRGRRNARTPKRPERRRR